MATNFYKVAYDRLKVLIAAEFARLADTDRISFEIGSDIEEVLVNRRPPACQDQWMFGAHGKGIERVDPFLAAQLTVACPRFATLIRRHDILLDTIAAVEVAACGQIQDPDMDFSRWNREWLHNGIIVRRHGALNLATGFLTSSCAGRLSRGMKFSPLYA